MGSKGKGGDVERRVSTRASARISVDNGDDEYDLAVAGMVADGFRPTQPSSMTGTTTPSLTSASSTTLIPDESPSSSNARPVRPSSTAKPPIPHFALPMRDRDPNALTRQTTNSTESTGFIPVEGPYQGPSGPSHPYGLYSQNVRSARTMSMATSSTMPMSESSYRGPRGPTHPYNLYPQGDGAASDTIQAAAIPLGFRGLPDQYQRRIGPDGEEIADMIGPDGHTEQLPPYTRYPEEAYVRKATTVEGSRDAVPGVAAAVPPSQTAPATALPSISGAGGLGLATRNPEFESTDDLGSPHSRHSTRSFTSDDSRRRMRLGDEGTSEKREPPKKWQAWMRRRLWGIIPYWAVLLTGIVLFFMAVILGAVIGTFIAGKHKRPPRKGGTWEETTPISPPPPDLQPLALGTYAMALSMNSRIPTCFKKPSESQAWNCHIVISGMKLTVYKEDGGYLASIDGNRSYTYPDVYSYGEQPPLIPEPVTLDLVEDNYEPTRGPAWHTALSYNKTVILPESFLSSDGSNAYKKARHVASIDAGLSSLKRKGIAQQGDRPWVCNWPNTYLQLFIYAQQNSSFSNWGQSLSMSTVSSTTTESTSTTQSAPTTSPPSSSTTSTDWRESSTSTSFPFPEDARMDDHDEGKYWAYAGGGRKMARSPGGQPQPASTESTMTTTTTESTSEIPTASSTGPFGPIDTGDGFPPLPQPYPRVIKLAERHISTEGAPKAQCTQVEIQGRGEEAKPVFGHDGMPIIIDIEETELDMFRGESGQRPSATATAGGADYVGRSAAAWEEEQASSWPLSPLVERGDGGNSPCGCVWYLT